MNRAPVTEEEIYLAFMRLRRAFDHALKKYPGHLASSHEGLGLIEEERHELVEAVRSNDVVNVRSEARDVAVVALFLEIWAHRGFHK